MRSLPSSLRLALSTKSRRTGTANLPFWHDARGAYCSPLSVIEQLADRLDAASVEAALDAILARRFAIEIDGRVLSLVTEAGREIFDADARAEFPLGFVLPRERIALPEEDGLHTALTNARDEPAGLERVQS